mgnify:CR=1 FL=1
MQMSDLRIALFSGNYNMTTDGANRALNRLVEYLLRQGAHFARHGGKGAARVARAGSLHRCIQGQGGAARGPLGG